MATVGAIGSMVSSMGMAKVTFDSAYKALLATDKSVFNLSMTNKILGKSEADLEAVLERVRKKGVLATAAF